ncbi:MAG TPA: hypothetical protein DCM62_04050 [Bacteroidales bacterium]|nr:hypothetical protein [Bacteroidales bacterium]
MKVFAAFFWMFFLTVFAAFTQERLQPLQSNPNKVPDYVTLGEATKSQPSSIPLPFRDDFSRPGPFPDPSLWSDRQAFVNTGMAVRPITVGVASFDLLDEHGHMYQAAYQTPYQFEADFLTSRAIQLAGLSPADSVLLTFYYQPQGLGGSPRKRDSLVVEFLKTPGHYVAVPGSAPTWVPDQWVSVWRTTGSTLAEFTEANGRAFMRGSVFINNPAYFHNQFRFRFKNYGSFAPADQSLQNKAGNNNIWNIDYVVLDRRRSKRNLAYFDIAFAGPAQSALRRYTAMPWSHFAQNPQAHLRQNFQVQITNLGSIVYNYLYRYFILDEQGRAVRTYSGGSWNIAPFSQSGLQTFAAHASPIVLPNLFPANAETTRNFRIVHVIREGLAGDGMQRNDTIAFNQKFSNFFAYDDGVAEAGYGLIGRNARGAFRFILSHPDTLHSVQFTLNRTLDDQNEIPIFITVWRSLQPEQVAYRSAVFRPDFDNHPNGVFTYRLQTPLPVSGTIFVGWEQRSEGFISMGYDANSPAGENIFFDTGAGWLPSIFQGALMIRAMVGGRSASLHDNPSQEVLAPGSIFPNPLKSDVLSIRLPETSRFQDNIRVEIFDLFGRLILSQEYTPTLHLGHLNNGVYLIRLTCPNNQLRHVERILIAR